MVTIASVACGTWARFRGNGVFEIRGHSDGVSFACGTQSSRRSGRGGCAGIGAGLPGQRRAHGANQGGNDNPATAATATAAGALSPSAFPGCAWPVESRARHRQRGCARPVRHLLAYPIPGHGQRFDNYQGRVPDEPVHVVCGIQRLFPAVHQHRYTEETCLRTFPTTRSRPIRAPRTRGAPGTCGRGSGSRSV